MKIKLLLLVISTLCYPLLLVSQELGTFHKVTIGINGLHTAVELPIGNKFTLEPAVGFGPSYTVDTNYSALTDKIGWHWAVFNPSFHASLHAKYIYNRNRRAAKNRSLLLNSGNYLGIKVKYVSRALSSNKTYNNTLLTSINWGGQHSIGKSWIWGYSVGLGYASNLDYKSNVFYPSFDLSIGYVLPFFSKKKNK